MANNHSPLNGMSPFSPVIGAAASARGGEGSRGCSSERDLTVHSGHEGCRFRPRRQRQPGLIRRTLSILFFLPLLVALAGCDFEDWGDSQRFTEDFHFTHNLPPNGRVVLENFNGSVEIYGWDKNQVEINGTKYANRRELLDAIRIDVTPSADSVQIRTIRPSDVRRGNMGAKYRIHVPRRVRLERIDSSNGGIRIEDVEGEARLKTSNGGVRLYRFTGDVEADTSNGPVELKEFAGGARLDTSNGPITASGVRGTFSATTSNGPIDATIESLDANRPVRLRTSNGPLRVKLGALNGNDVFAQSSNGPVTVVLPSGAGAKVRASTSNSSIQCDFDLNGPITQSKSRLEGTIGSGGPLLDLSTSNGSIRIQRM
jgi:hypothetical protein